MYYLLCGIIGFALGNILARIDNYKYSKWIKRVVQLLVIIAGLGSITYVTYQLRH